MDLKHQSTVKCWQKEAKFFRRDKMTPIFQSLNLCILSSAEAQEIAQQEDSDLSRIAVKDNLQVVEVDGSICNESTSFENFACLNPFPRVFLFFLCFREFVEPQFCLYCPSFLFLPI